MPSILDSDSDFRLCRITFAELLGIHERAELLQWGTRWTSECALRNQVRDQEALLMTFARELRGGSVRSIRCLVLAARAADPGGCIVTVDVEPDRVSTLGDAVQDPHDRLALSRVMRAALAGGIEHAEKG